MKNVQHNRSRRGRQGASSPSSSASARHSRLYLAGALAALVGAGCSGSIKSGSGASTSSADSNLTTLVGVGGRCADVQGYLSDNLTPIILFDCKDPSNNGNQAWQLTNGTITGLANKCLDLQYDSSDDGTPIDLYDCNGSDAQKWTYANGQITNTNGKCIGVRGGISQNLAPLELETCSGSAGQTWSLGAGATSGSDGGVGSTTDGGSTTGGGSSSGGSSTHGPRLYSDASPWNTPVPDGATYHDQSVLHIRPSATTGDLGQHYYLGDVATYVSQPGDPLWAIVSPEHRGRPAQTVMVHGPANMVTGPNADGTVSLIDGDIEYDFWLFVNTPQNGAYTASDSAWGEDNAITGTGWGYGDPGHGGMNSGVRATNTSWGAGLITQADIDAGVIDHALAIALTPDMLMPAHVAPASIEDNFGGDDGPIPSGARIFIPPGSPKPDGLSPLGELVWTSLSKYGMYVVDSCLGAWPFLHAELGISTAVSTPLWVFWNGPNQSDTSDIGKMSPYFRVVDYATPTVYHY